MKQKRIVWILAVALLAAVVVVVVLLTKKPAKTQNSPAATPAEMAANEDDKTAESTKIVYSKVVETLDLSGQTTVDVEQIMGLKQLKELNLRGTHISNDDYAKIREALPDCKILWSVLVGSVYNDDDSENIEVFKFEEADVEALKYLPNLKKVDAFSITDEESFKYLAEALLAYPDIKIQYKVPLGMADIQSDVNKVSLKVVNLEALRFALTYLPKLTEVEFKGERPSDADMQQLIEDFPNVKFY